MQDQPLRAQDVNTGAKAAPVPQTLVQESPPPPTARLRAWAAALWPWRWRGLALLAALAVTWLYGGALLLGPQVAVEPVMRTTFVQTVVASGHVEAPYRINVGSQITGVVARVPVAEGQLVKAGDTLIVLDDREAQAAVTQAEASVAQATARLRQLRELTLPSAAEALAQAKATLLNAEQAYTRASKLAGDGYSSRATLDEATKALNIAQAQVRNAEFQVFTNKPGGSDYVMAETLLDQAKSALVSAHSRLSYTTIKAQRDGVLISRAVEAGNVVQPANVLMTLSPTGATQLVIQVDEKNLGLIALGQHALASADAFPKDTFVAEVAYINPAIDLQRASVEVKLAVPDPPVYLRQDMTVSVDIEAGRHAEALVVPASVIEGITSKTPWVMKIAGRRAVRTPVKVGLTSGGKAEILNGLAAGDVLAAQPLTLKNGARARAKPSPAARS